MAGDRMGHLRMAPVVAALGKMDRAAPARDLARPAGQMAPAAALPATSRCLLPCATGFLLGYLKGAAARGEEDKGAAWSARSYGVPVIRP